MTELAYSDGETGRREVTFKVSQQFLEAAESGEWSAPVTFRFERLGSAWSLVVRTYECPVIPVAKSDRTEESG